MRKTIFILIISLLASIYCCGQATVGLIQNNSAEDGYELFAPIQADTTYLIDKCGRLIHQWASTNNPGFSVYLMPDGSLVRAGNIPSQIFRGNGEQGGMIEKYDWNNNLTWSYILSSDTQTQNHDIYPLANGNILAVVWEAIDSNTAIAAGRDPARLSSQLFSAEIQELQPVGLHQATVVWQWRLWDHLIQDFDSTKSNYGVIADHPELINLNYTDSAPTSKDWIHANAVTYDSTRDQIILSAHNFSEIWILDHSTTTAQATTHSGGTHAKGGDLLYRWGNPQAYGRGTAADEVFYTQHNPGWIPAGYPNAGSIIVFNNGLKRPGGNASSVDIFTPPVDVNGNYTIAAGQPYGPSGTLWSYEATPPASFFGTSMGGAQPLPNGNVIVCEGPAGNFFEIDSNKNVLWRYINPVNADTDVTQGFTPVNNGVFRCTQYDPSYSAFTGNTLTPMGHIEKDPILTHCDSVSLTAIRQLTSGDIMIYPNPAIDKIVIVLSAENSMMSYQLTDMLGQVIMKGNIQSNMFDISLAGMETGMYIVTIASANQRIQKKIIINQ
jgi:hypothetical protein